MDPLTIGVCGIAALFLLIVLKVPIAFSLIAVGVAGFALQTSWVPALTLLSSEPAGILASIDVATIPLFLLMGTFASAAGFSSDIYAVLAAFLGHRRGGLGYATISGSAVFGSVCGSSAATVLTFTQIALPEMLRRNYSVAFAAGSIAAGGAMKALIPPSLVMILYSVVAKTFIFDVFIAAIIPAALCILLNLLAIAIYVRLHPAAAPAIKYVPWADRMTALRRATPSFILLITVFAGIYSGIFTVNEAASVAAVMAAIFAFLRRQLTKEKLLSGMTSAAGATAMLYGILIGASAFTQFVNLARTPEALVALVGHLALPPLLLILVILLAYLVLGAFFDEIAAMLITLPFVLPIIVQLGYDPIWWCIINVVIIELGLIVPPIGLVVFLLHGVAPHISLRTIYSGVAPFIVADVLLLIILVLFPSLALWLPKAIGG